MSTEFETLCADLKACQAKWQEAERRIQTMGQERVDILNMLSELDELRARVARKNARIAKLHAQLDDLQVKYNKLLKEVAE